MTALLFQDRPYPRSTHDKCHRSTVRDPECGAVSFRFELIFRLSIVLQRWIGAPDFPSEWAGTRLTSASEGRSKMPIVQCPSLALQACCKRLPRHRLHSRRRSIWRCNTKHIEDSHHATAKLPAEIVR